jgi:prepilin-type N-terminal cleavage/methylation domain-containing protein
MMNWRHTVSCDRYDRGQSSRGLTMVEMLMVVVLISLIGLATFHSLVNGFKVWERTTRQGVEWDVALFFEKLSSDLKNSFPFSQIGLMGDSQQLSFPTIIYARQDRLRRKNPDDYATQVGQAEYTFDKNRFAVLRSYAYYGQSLKKKMMPARLLAAPVVAVEFRYYYGQNQKVVVQPDTKLGRPLAVEVSVDVKDRTGQVQQYRRFIYLPT